MQHPRRLLVHRVAASSVQRQVFRTLHLISDAGGSVVCKRSLEQVVVELLAAGKGILLDASPMVDTRFRQSGLSVLDALWVGSVQAVTVRTVGFESNVGTHCWRSVQLTITGEVAGISASVSQAVVLLSALL